MDFKVIWLPSAIEDLRLLTETIATDDPSAAWRFGTRILDTAELLERFPNFGRPYPATAREDVRQIPVPPYRSIYRIVASERPDHILTVWHGARQLPSKDELE